MNLLICPSLVLFVVLLILQPAAVCLAQNAAAVEIKGTVSAADGEPIVGAHIVEPKSGKGAASAVDGTFKMSLPANFPVQLQVSAIGWMPQTVTIAKASEKNIAIVLQSRDKVLGTVEITGARVTSPHIQRINPDFALQLPSTAGYNIEGVVRSQMGVTSNSELSSQYRVRGGNFDENLVYVNGQEVYRPFLIRSGQQEGLSFVNPDLVETVEFSAGGFSASYGDKMSSVLDIQYKRPKETAGSASVGILGANAHLEGSAFNNKLTWITGARYKTSSYLLGTLDTKGEYMPDFTDVQAYITYSPTSRLTLDVLGYYSMNTYRFVPEFMSTSFGTLSELKQLRVYFDGSEIDRFQTGYGAVSATFNATTSQSYKLTLTGFRTSEEETYDIDSQYWLSDAILPSERDEEITYTEAGVGESWRHARNNLIGNVVSANFTAAHKTGIGTINWGTIYQYEYFKDNIHEYEMVDSSFYTIPRPSGNRLEMAYFKHGRNIIGNHRASAFVKNLTSWTVGNGNMIMDVGIRGSYSSYIDEFIFSPRLQLTWLPAKESNYRIRLSGGYYYQPPLVKEYRKPDGSYNTGLKSQKSIQAVSGIDYYFTAFERPFKFTSEAYFKKYENLVTYQIDNVRVIYSGENDAHGYAAGIDFKLNGELVHGEESWVTLSLMRTQEDLWHDVYLNPDKECTPGYTPRPSDQLLNFSLFLQDHLPTMPALKAHLSFFFGTGFPYGPPNSPRYLATMRYKAYRRIDLGLSYDLLTINSFAKGFGKYLKNFRIGAEILNLPDMINTISHSWVNDIDGTQYAVPNYLTSRRVNVRVAVEF
ncbi:MAG: carboxypeptidase-like regulatory domain-containing protein [Cytophagaceae bacterium]|jgi:hypothetical protein|nr:carboxypeptidase-like regulatory domain-containing protein [Cytophagaceae bacterium]